MFNIGPWELILILVIALIVVGPGKLPDVAKALGKATREFKKATTGIQKEIDQVVKSAAEEPKPAAKIETAGTEGEGQIPSPPQEEGSRE